MKILNAFNMAQDAYHVTKAMRDRGLDADLLVNLSSGDDYSDPNWELSGSSSVDWVKNIPVGRLKSLKLYSMFRDYDVVFCHVPSSLYAQFMPDVRWIPYDAGLIRYLNHSKQSPTYDKNTFYRNLRMHLLTRSYQKAKVILFTNPDTEPLFNLLGCREKLRFVPFVIDTDRYSPKKFEPNNPPLFFSPTRHSWSEKGNDLLIFAFAKFLHYRESLLNLTDWGPDINRSKDLISKLGIGNCVKWLSPCNKLNLIERYRSADMVLDQFVLGSYGTSVPEAMACGKPVATYLSFYHRACFGEFPPIFNCNTVEGILDAMMQGRSESLCKEIGKKAREYVKYYHDGQKVVDIHLKAAEEVC